MAKIRIDVLLNERFYGQVTINANPNVPIPIAWIEQEIEEKFPTLKGKDYEFFKTEQVVAESLSRSKWK